MTRDQMGRVSLIIVSVGICLALGWPAAYTIAQNIFGEAGLNGGPGLTRPDGEAPANDAPSASFTVSIPDSIVADFTDTSTDAQGDSTITSWAWVFGDGTTSTAQSPEKTYDYYGGDRIVNLTVSDERGSQDTAQDTVYVRPGWVVGDLEIITSDSLSYTFIGSAFVPTGWNTEVDQYIVVRPGTNNEEDAFSTQLEVTLPAGLDSVLVWHTSTVNYGGSLYGEVSDFNEYWIPVADPPGSGPSNVAPVASFTVDETNTPVIDFTDTSTDSDGTIVSWLWEFGDGSTNNSQNPTKTYGLCDCTRTVILTVTDNDGDSDSDTTTVDIGAPVAGSPTVTSVTGTFSDDETVTITGSGFGGKSPAAPLIWEDFNDMTSGEYLNSEDSSWNIYQDNGARVSTAGARDGTIAAYNDWELEADYATNWKSFAATDTVFHSYWLTLTSSMGSAVAKYGKIGSGAGRTYDGRGNWSWSHYQWLHYRTDSTSSILFQNTQTGTTTYPPGDGNWFRVDYTLANSTPGVADGTAILELTSAGGNSDRSESIGDVPLQYSGSNEFQWSSVQLGLMYTSGGGTKNPDVIMRTDDVYVDNTWARVEIGDNADYLLSDHREMLIPSSWSGSTIQATFNEGSFSSGDSVYVFVIHSDNTPSAGYGPIAIDGSSGPPSAPTITSFAADDTTVTTTQSVDFTATLGGGTPTSYTWRWGDGTSFGTTAAPSHTFSSVGTYDVTLVVSNAAGADSTTKSNYITSSVGNSPPSAAIAVTDSASVDAVVLDRSSSTDSDGTIDTTRWTPWSGSWTRVANQDTIVVDYTSQQSTGDVVVEPKVVVVDNDSAADSTTTFYTIPGTGGGGGLPYTENFEGGSIPAEWAEYDTFGSPTHTVSASTDSFSSYAGTYHARISDGTSIAAWDVSMPDLTGEANVYISFYATSSATYDVQNRIYISVDGGATFEGTHTDFRLQDGTAWTWDLYSYGIDELASANSVSLNDQVVIRIQAQMPDADILGIDNVTVDTGNPP